MTDNFAQFSLSVDRFVDYEVPQAVQGATVKIGFQALKGIVNKTPVDTGRARGNWQVRLGAPGERVLKRRDRSGHKALHHGTNTILRVRPFGSIWISNNLPYARRLEHGSSAQAPSGMVAVTLTEIESQFRRIE